MLEKYGIDDPSTNDNVGVYTDDRLGTYFTEKYIALLEQAQGEGAYEPQFLTQEKLDEILGR